MHSPFSFTKKARNISLIILLTIIFLVFLYFFRSNHFNWKQDVMSKDDISIPCYSTTIQNTTYYFPQENFDIKVANKYVSSISKILEYSDTFFSTPVSNEPIYVGFDSNSIPLNDKGPSYEDLWSVVKTRHLSCIDSAEIFGLFAVYSKQNHLTDDSFLNLTDAELSEIKNTLSADNSIYLLDFTLPMIEDVYFNEEETSNHQKMVFAFSDWYVNTYTFQDYEKLCSNISTKDSQLEALKNDWLHSLGCSSHYSEFGKIKFQYAYTELSTYKIDKDDVTWFWSDSDVQQLGYQEMVRNYLILEPLREQDFADARLFLKDYLPDGIEKVNIQTQFSSSDYPYSAYDSSHSHTIYLVEGWIEAGRSLLHEYCHFLTIGENRILPVSGFFADWYAVEISSIELKNRMKETFLVMHFGEDYLKDVGYWDNSSNQFSSKLGTYRDALQASETTIKSDSLSLHTLSYAEQGVLAKYLIEEESLDYLVKMTQEQYNYEKILGKTLDDLYNDMLSWLRSEIPTN